ncbi:MAG: hypothetical protein QOF79_404 [Actinomycetota bacterium]|nr:hypothetical protein [Actinomycetota bacterium]
MKYMLLIYGNTDAWNAMTKEGTDEVMRVHQALQQELIASGELLETNELPLDEAKIVRTKGGVPAVTDGPFIEVKEILAGFYLLECASIERATEVAGRLVEAEFSLVEVRHVGR